MPPQKINAIDIIGSLPGVSHVVLLTENGTPEGGSSQTLRFPGEWFEGLQHFASSQPEHCGMRSGLTDGRVFHDSLVAYPGCHKDEVLLLA